MTLEDAGRACKTLPVSDELILASDEDRSRVIARLQQARVEGRLTAEELAQRVEAAEHARTIGDLELTLAGLPRPPERSQHMAVAAAETEGYGGGAIAAGVLLTLLVPFGDIAAVIIALAKLSDERVPARRAQLRLWALGSAVLVLLKLVALLLFVA